MIEMLKKKVLVKLDDESLRALEAFDEDVKALFEMIHDLAETSHQIREMIETAALAEVATEIDGDDVGVVVEQAAPNGAPMVAWMGEDVTPGETTIRSTPFTRAPRQVQVDWLTKVMADGEWHAPFKIARDYATDERHLRYMRGAVTARCREMWEEGLLDRRDSHTKGSMYEFKLAAR